MLQIGLPHISILNIQQPIQRNCKLAEVPFYSDNLSLPKENNLGVVPRITIHSVNVPLTSILCCLSLTARLPVLIFSLGLFLEAENRWHLGCNWVLDLIHHYLKKFQVAVQ